jgi:twitching motility protein PilT
MMEIFNEVTDDFAKKRFAERGEVDVSYEIYGVGRFRANLFRQRGYIGMVFRHIHSKIPSMEELNLPAEQLKRLSMQPRGLILVTGTAGSGKSTTIASMINFINNTEEKHIISIEDPIEFTFQDTKCVIDQREVGQDTDSFLAALKHAVRQSPDVIFIGEMRDLETMEAAINAAETGHLVFSTLHSLNAMQTVDRILNMFPVHQHQFLQLQLAQLLEGVVSQRLLPTKDGAGRMAAVELMCATPTTRELLLHGKTRELYKALKEGSYYGCMTFNQSLKSLLERDLITLEDALHAADNPDELKLELRGISKDNAQRWGSDVRRR